MFMLYRILKSKIQNICITISTRKRHAKEDTPNVSWGFLKHNHDHKKQFSVFCDSLSLFVFLTAFPRLYPQL